MQKVCANPWCQTPFEIRPEDLLFYEKVSPVIGGKTYAVPPPDYCFQCRLQRRLAFYNSRSLYRRKCDFSGKPMVSTFSPDKPFLVYDKDIWLTDQWDPLAYGQDPDFSQPFFPQFRQLLERVPLQSLAIIGPDNINSDFTNDNYKIKNCYLVFDGEQAEDSYYGQTFLLVRNSLEFASLQQSELCYECVHCQQCYNVRHSRYCMNCSESWFLRDCIGCKNCFGCANLRQKQYCVFNEQKTRAEYETFIKYFRSSSHAEVRNMQQQSESLFISLPVKAMRGEQNINTFGDNVSKSKNAYCCFDCNDQEDTAYMTDCMMTSKDCQDIHIWGDGMELSYNCCCVGANSRNLLCNYYASVGCSDIAYSVYCGLSSSDLFGCVGLRHKKHCILNKQYSKEDYELIAGRIIEHMQKTGEWGQFFPPDTALYGYNETMAQTFFPMSKDEAQEHGFQWSEYEVTVEADRVIDAKDLPDDTTDIPDDVLHWAIRCEMTGKPFKIIKQELAFYREHRLPVPRRHPDRRHTDRYALKNPYRLFSRKCSRCNKEIQATYAPERSEIVLCEECYLKEVY